MSLDPRAFLRFQAGPLLAPVAIAVVGGEQDVDDGQGRGHQGNAFEIGCRALDRAATQMQA